MKLSQALDQCRSSQFVQRPGKLDTRIYQMRSDAVKKLHDLKTEDVLADDWQVYDHGA